MKTKTNFNKTKSNFRQTKTTFKSKKEDSKKPDKDILSDDDNTPIKKKTKKIETNVVKDNLNYAQLMGSIEESQLTSDNILKDNSLVSYDTPFLVSSTISNKKLLEELDESNENSELFLKNIINNDSGMDYSLKDALNKILPPMKVKIDDQTWVRYVSSDPVTNDRVTKLREDLDRRLVQENARTSGICPIKERLYNECFDELIRQVTINCLERGILLMRVKEETEMVINQYQMLYESCIAYGMRVFLVADQEKKTTLKKISQTEDICDALEKDIKKLQKELEDKKKADKEERERLALEHEAFVENYRKLNGYFKADIKEKMSK